MKRFLVLLLCFVMMLSLMPVTASAASSLTVDCSSVLRGATHCASGSLYGLTVDKPSDLSGLVAPLNPYVFRNPARTGTGNQHNNNAAAIAVAQRLNNTVPSAKVSVDLADMLPGWPYTWPGMSSWLSQVESFINDMKASGTNNWYGVEIWNEPYVTWNDGNGSFNDMWLQTYNLIRSIDSSIPIIGPCESHYDHNRMSSFLSFCISNNCLPDIMSWHELVGIQYVAGHLQDYRNLETTLGINHLPLSINEYCDSDHSLEGQPGSAAQFIAKFERYKVDSACWSWWYVPYPGRLGSLLATDTQKGAGWYFFKWYGDMTGNMVSVTPPNDNADMVDGAACVDSNAKYVSFIFGGNNDGTINTTFTNLPSFIGSTAQVSIEKIDWISKDTVSSGPAVISTSNYNVVNGQITVSLSGCNNNSGYRIYITPGSGTSTIQSGQTYQVVNRNSGLVLAVENASTTPGANVIQETYSGANSQLWVITSTPSGYTLKNVGSGQLLDVDNNSTSNGANVLQWPDNSGLNQRWTIMSTSDGYYKLLNVKSGKALDVENQSTFSGANVCQWTDHGGTNQQWALVSQTSLYIEAESAQGQSSFPPFAVQTDTNASGGQYIVWPDQGNANNPTASDNTAGQASYTFYLSASSNVSFSARVLFSNADNDSFHYKIDSGTWQTQNNSQSTVWDWKYITTFNNLSAGQHTLTIERREDGAKIDQLQLVVSAGTIH